MELSVIIPAYNAEKYLVECLDSVFQKVNMSFECIVVNDGSLDSTEQILEEYSLKEKRLNYISTLNNGVSSARNLGISKAQGEYILFLDSDDYLTENAMSIISQVIASKKDIYVFNHYENRGKKETKGITILPNLKTADEIIDYYAIQNNYLNPVWGKVLKRDIIIKNQIVFPKGMKFGEDACFMLEYLKHVKSIELFDTVLLKYRIHDTNSIHVVTKSRLDDYYFEMKERIALCQSMHKQKSLNMLYRTYMMMLFYYCISYVESFSIVKLKIYYKDIKESYFYKEIVKNIQINQCSKKDYIIYILLNHFNSFLFYLTFRILNVFKKIKHQIM